MEKSNDTTSNPWGGQMQNVVESLQNVTIPPIAPNQGVKALYQLMEDPVLDLKPALMSSDIGTLRTATRAISELFFEPNAPIQKTIDAGLIPRLVELSSHPDNDIQLMSLEALSNLVSGTTDQTLIVVGHGALEVFKQRLEDGIDDVREQAVWGIGNIAGDSVDLRDLCLESGVMPLVLEMLTSSSLTRKRLAAWTVLNFCRGRPSPNLDDVRSCIPVMVECLKNETDPEVLRDSIWCLSLLSDYDDDSEVEVFETGVAPYLLAKLREETRRDILVPTLRVLGNFCSGPDHHVDYLISQGILDDLGRIMKGKTMKDAFRIVSYILCGTTEQNTAAMVLMPTILEFIVTPTAGTATLEEALWCLHAALTDCSNLGIELLLSYQPQKAILTLLKSPIWLKADPSLYTEFVFRINEVADQLFDEEQWVEFNESV